MRMGIDWVAMAIVLVAYVLGQLKSISLKVRYGIWAAAMVLIVLTRLKAGFGGVTGAVTALAIALAAFYAWKAIRTPSR